MPNVGGKQFPYTPGGMAAASEAASSSRNGPPILDEDVLSMPGGSELAGLNMSPEELTQKLLALGLDERTVALLIEKLTGAGGAARDEAPPEGF